MKLSWLHRTGDGRRVLLFFNGWSMDDTLFEGWETSGVDVLTVCDYTRLEPLPELAGYEELHLAAWSLGVRVAAELLENMPYRFETATAFNGTLRPVDAEFGIDPAIFAGTAEHWGDERAWERFYRRLAGSAPFRQPRRTPESQQEELVSLQKHIESSPVPVNPFRRAWISGRDRIIPAAAQRKFWAGESVAVTEKPDAPHFPFGEIHSFEEIIDAGRDR